MSRVLAIVAFLLAALATASTASAEEPESDPVVTVFERPGPNVFEQAVKLLDWRLVRADVGEFLVKANFDPVCLRLAVNAPVQRLQLYWDVGFPPGAPTDEFQAATGFQIVF